MRFGPRFTDEGRLGDIAASTLSSYRLGAAGFMDFLCSEGYSPLRPEEWDDLLVEWWHARSVTLSTFRSGVAAVEFVYPHLRGKLIWAHQKLSTLNRITPPRHAAPCGRELSALLGAQLSSLRRARMGLALVLQNALGLRPGEVISLVPGDVRRSPERDKQHVVVFRLGGQTGGTKSGREQFAILHTNDHLHLWPSLCIAIALTPSDSDRIFPFSMSSYYHWIKEAQRTLGIELHITPHSPRAGFVTDHLLLGTPPNTIKEAGRWTSDSSFHLYRDAVGALHAAQSVRVAGLGPAIAWVIDHLDEYFTEQSLDAYGLRPGSGSSPASDAIAEGAYGHHASQGEGGHAAASASSAVGSLWSSAGLARGAAVAGRGRARGRGGRGRRAPATSGGAAGRGGASSGR